MSKLEIPCPQCGRKLQLPDRKMLGRKGRCGKCGHKFLLTEPRSPESRPPVFAEAPSPPPGNMQFEYADDLPDPGADKTMMGISVRYIPEEPSLKPSSAVARALVPQPPARPPVEEFPLPGLMLEQADEPANGAVSKLREKRKQARRQKMIFGGAALAVCVIGAGVFFGLSGNQSKKNLAKKSTSRPAKAQPEAGEGAEEPEDSTKAGAGAKDKPGDPITLALVPEGAGMLIHLRPADLWQSGGSAEEFRACLGPVGVWLESTIKKYCLLPPSDIEEVLFALTDIKRESFGVAVVVRSKKDLKRSEIIDKFDGELVDKPREHYIGKERAWLVFDNRTFASAPKDRAEALAEAANSPSVTTDGIQALLSMTDRKRHFTIVCDLTDVRLGVTSLAPESARKLLDGVVDFFGDDVETLAWCLNLGDVEGANNLRSEVFVRNRLSRSPPKLQADLQQKLAKLPAELLELVYMTHPKKIGDKKIVGRFPIMTKIVERSTKFDTAHRLVSMKVELPERAGPNLALGTLLTWNQTTLPDFGTSSKTEAPVVAVKSSLPDKIADRLKKKITVEFKREFMYKAIEFIGEETGVQIKIDGPGLKEVGLTQNIYQTFAMEDVPATAVLYKIVIEGSLDKGKPQLVLIVDENGKMATITSVPTAEKKKLTPFPLDPAPK